MDLHHGYGLHAVHRDGDQWPLHHGVLVTPPVIDRSIRGLIIANVYFFPNGQVVVLDQHGRQMPEYQGEAKRMRFRIDAKISVQSFRPSIYGERFLPKTEDA